MITHAFAALFVADVPTSRAFYETLLGVKPVADSGVHVLYSGFSIWQRSMAHNLIFGGDRPAGRDGFELCLECGDVAALYETLRDHPALLNPLIEQPWGQRVFRLRDPDGHLVELSEPLSQVVARLRREGQNDAAIAAKLHVAVADLDKF
ncbi:MAG: VOC family protein [Campylobacterales bacterium]